MKLLLTIKDKPIPTKNKIPFRYASRAIVFDKNNLIPLLFVSNQNYHKLPGGGIEDGESKIKALEREILEETGCKMEVRGEVGKIVEYRSEFNLIQTSYCYFGTVLVKGKQSLTEEETSEKFELIWVLLSEAISKIKNDKPLDYEGSFIQQRDLRFLEEFNKSNKNI